MRNVLFFRILRQVISRRLAESVAVWDRTAELPLVTLDHTASFRVCSAQARTSTYSTLKSGFRIASIIFPGQI